MKSIMSVLVVTIMVFGLVSSSVAGCFPFSCNANSANVSAKDADNPGHFLTGTPYACGIQSPARPDYVDAVPLPCTERDRDRYNRTPEPMGSPGF